MTEGRYVAVFKDAAGEFRWHRIATASGDITADSGEGYTERNDAAEAAAREFPDDEIRIIED